VKDPPPGVFKGFGNAAWRVDLAGNGGWRVAPSYLDPKQIPWFWLAKIFQTAFLGLQ